MVEEVVRLRDAIDGLADLDAGSLSDDDLGAVLIDLHQQKQRLCAEEARLTGSYEARRAFAGDGSRTAAARLARDTKSSPEVMRAQTRLGRRLRLMPEATAVLRAGDITVEHARVLGDLAASPRTAVADAFVRGEQMLVEQAKTLEFDDWVRAVRYWEQQADEDGAEEKATKQYQSRRLHLSQTLDGMWVLDGLLDPIGGTIVATALRRIEKNLFEQDWADAKAEQGDDVLPGHLTRTPAQRRADALVEMAERAMAAPIGARLPRPLITVHVGFETFAGRLCELANRMVITPGQILPLLTHADIERAVFEGPKRIIELGERTRFFRGGLRRIAEILYRTCSFPGCDVPAEECHVDHVQEYEDGGLTVQENSDLRCDTHNWHKHNTKKQGQNKKPRRRRKRKTRPGKTGKAQHPTGRESPPTPPLPTEATTGDE